MCSKLRRPDVDLLPSPVSFIPSLHFALGRPSLLLQCYWSTERHWNGDCAGIATRSYSPTSELTGVLTNLTLVPSFTAHHSRMSSPNLSQLNGTKNDKCNDEAVIPVHVAAAAPAAAGNSEESGGDDGDLSSAVCVGSICGRLTPLHARAGGLHFADGSRKSSNADTGTATSVTGTTSNRSCFSAPESDDDESSSLSSSSSSSSSTSRSMSTIVSEYASSSSGSVLSSDDDGEDDKGGQCYSSCGDEDLSDLEGRMKRKYAGRDKLLRTIARKNRGNSAYMNFLRQNELTVRAEANKILEEKKELRSQRRNHRRKLQGNEFSSAAGVEMAKEGKDARENSSTNCCKSPPRATSRKPQHAFARIARFEFYHTSGGFVTLVFYCLAHISLYELVSNLFLECTRYTQQSQQVVYSAIFIFALILSRLSGGIFAWVEEDTYDGIKFDCHNRLRLADFDVLILRWFRRHPAIKHTSDIASLYLCFMSVSYFVQYWMLPTLLDARDDILSNLPSLRFDFCTTRLQEILGDGLSGSCSSIDLSGFEGERACFDNSNALSESGTYCYDAKELGEALTDEDWDYFSREVSVSSMYSFVGDSQAALTRPASVILFYAACAAFSIIFLAKIYRFRFWDF